MIEDNNAVFVIEFVASWWNDGTCVLHILGGEFAINAMRSKGNTGKKEAAS